MKEIRSNEIIQASGESRRIEGTGVVFNSESVDLGGFTEIISPSAISEETLRNSDILFLLDHNRERGVLARSKKGSGSLEVSVDESGVHYAFDAPHTALGDEVLEGLRRGDINKCSFAFTVKRDSWVKRQDGTVLRTIEEIDQLFDLSIVYNPAYESTNVVNKRGLEELVAAEAVEAVEVRSDDDKEAEKDEQDDEKPVNEEEKPVDEPVATPDEPEDENRSDEPDTPDDEPDTPDNDEEEKSGCDDEEPEENRSDEPETEPEQRNLYDKSNITYNNMPKKFSLIGTINDAIAMRSNEYVNGGVITLPFETRAEGDAPEAPAAPAAPTAGINPVTPNGIMQSQDTMGHESIKQSMWPLLTDLKNRLILNELGAQFIHADSEISIPKYSSGTCAWLGEVDHAVDAAGKFESEKIVPKRLSCYLDISNTWLRMTGADAENILRQELINCISQKIEETVFSNIAGTPNRPEGMFYNVTSDTTDFKFEDAISMEQALEEANAYSGTVKYAASPAAKHYLRTLPIDKGSGRMVMESNDVLGVPCVSSNNVTNRGLILGDWRELFVVLFSNMTIVTDTLTKAAYDQTRIIVNLSVAPYIRRPECFVKRILK